VRARHLHFVSVLKRKADFKLNFDLFNTRIPLGWQKWYGNRVKTRREIPEGQNLNNSWETANGYLFYNYQKPWLIQRARGSFATQVN